MDMPLSRRDFGRLIAGTTASAALAQLSRSAAIAAPVAGYKAMVGIFLFGGNDGWNMVVPTDARYAAYASARGSGIALPAASLQTLGGSPFALHPALAPLGAIWNEGALGIVLNTGTLSQPITKAQYQASADVRPLNLMSHADEQAHWQGLRAREANVDGFMGRLADRMAQTTMPSLISFTGSNLAVLGKTGSSMVLPSAGTLVQSGASASTADPVIFARNNAVAAFADLSGSGAVTTATGQGIASDYALAVTANGIINATASSVDKYFVDPTTGAALTSDLARQLLRTARMIEARSTLGQARQSFFIGQPGYDTHNGQVSGDNTTGVHAGNLATLAMAITAFYNAMKALGLSENVTTFTMSDFGRTYKGNAQRGTDHAWGSNHLVIGGALAGKTVHGTYPSQILSGADDITAEGRFIPGIAQEEYLGRSPAGMAWPMPICRMSSPTGRPGAVAAAGRCRCSRPDSNHNGGFSRSAGHPDVRFDDQYIDVDGIDVYWHASVSLMGWCESTATSRHIPARQCAEGRHDPDLSPVSIG